MERSDFIRHIERGRETQDIPHVVVPLLGHNKGETGERSHLLLLANCSNSGIEIRKWVDRMVELLARENHEGAGPAICYKDGSLIPSFEIDNLNSTATTINYYFNVSLKL